MSHRWYYQLLMEEFGPVTEDQLRQLIDEGTLADDDQIRPEDSSVWKTVASLGATTAQTVSMAEPETLADLSDLNFEFEDSKPANRSATTSRSAALRPELASESSLDADSLLSELPPIISNAEADLLQPVRKQSAAKSADFTEQYYCQSLGQSLGPMPLAELVGMFAAGALVPEDLVRKDPQATWLPSTQFPEIAAAVRRIRPEGTSTIPSEKTQAATLSIATQKRLAHPAPESPLSPPKDSSAPSPDSAPAAVSAQPASRAGVSAQPSAPATVSAQSPAKDTQRPKVPRDAAKPKGKKKTLAKEDAVLDEIFDDVFSDDAAKPVGSRPPMFSVPGDASAKPPQGGPGEFGSSTASGFDAGSTGGPSYAAPSPSPVPPAFSAPKPVLPPKRKSSSSSGTSMQVSGKTMGIVGGSIAAIGLIVGVFLGAIPLPGMGGIIRPNPETVLVGVHEKVKGINPDTITQEELTKLQTEFLEDVSYALQDLGEIADPTPRQTAMKGVGRKLLDIAYVRHDAKNVLKDFLKDLNQQMVDAPK